MTILSGRYELERRLGGGGMAEVFLARLVGKDGFSRRVAIKRVLAHLATDESFARMFVAEAQICARLQHPNIVSVLDFDRDEEGRPFLVIELVDGPSLAELADAGALPVGAALYLASEVLRGLAYAHELPGGEGGVRGIVHRDISPHNVLLSWEGAVKVSDFGIAKARAASGVTASELLKGKPAYMSPEQANGEVLDGRSDLFAVGTLLWELLVGRSLFSGHTTQETLARVLFAPIPTPRSIRPELPQEVDAVVMTLLARERADRYADANDAIAALVACKDYPRDGREQLVALLADRFATDAPQRSRTLAEVPTVRTPFEGAPTMPAPRDARRARPIALVAAAMAIAAVAVVVTLVATRSSSSSSTTDVATEEDAGNEPAVKATRELGAPRASEILTDAGTEPPSDAARSSSYIATDGAAPSDKDDATRPSRVGSKPSQKASEAQLQAIRAEFVAAAKKTGRSSLPFPPGDDAAVDPLRYLEQVRAEVQRLFGTRGTVIAFSMGLEANGRVNGTIPGRGLSIAVAVPPTPDGFFCVEVSSHHKDSPRFKMMLVNADPYCRALNDRAGEPRCSGDELHQRAVERGYSPAPSPSLDAKLRNGRWYLFGEGLQDVSVPNDCH